MAKYIIDIEDEYTKDWINETSTCKELCMPISVPNRQRTYHVITGFKLEPYTEPDRKAIDLQYARDIENVARMNYNEGAKDAWDFAKAINYMGYDDFVSCFGGKTEEAVYELSYSEVKAEYDAWKAESEQIHVGDEVVVNGTRAVVMKLDETGNIDRYFTSNGTTFGNISGFQNYEVTKTNRHFPEVAELLKKMRGSDED